MVLFKLFILFMWIYWLLIKWGKNGWEEVILYFKPDGKIYCIAFLSGLKCAFSCVSRWDVLVCKKRHLCNLKKKKKKANRERTDCIFENGVILYSWINFNIVIL